MTQATKEPSFADVLAAAESVRAEWASLLVNPRLKFDAEKEWAIQCCEKNKSAADYAVASPAAVAAALRNVAAVGVTLDPARKLAYILPRDSKMVYDLSYMGLLDLAVSSGALQWGQAHLVYENDVFELMGYDAAPVHKRNPFAKADARGALVGAYVVVKTSGGDYLTNTMGIEEIHAIRDRSPSWKSGQKGPWKTDFAEMAKKTVVKNAYKYWPRSEALDRAVHYLNTDAQQGIALDGAQNVDRAELRKKWDAEVAQAKTGEELRELLNAGREEFRASEDLEGYAAFQKLVAARVRELAPPPAHPAAAPTTAAANTPPASATKAAAAKPVNKAVPDPKAPAGVLAMIQAAEDDPALEATGVLIDALPADQQPPLNDAYNARLSYLNKKFNRKAA